MEYPNKFSFIEALSQVIGTLPKEVTGKMQIRNSGDRKFFNLVDIKDLEGNKIDLPDGSILKGVYIGIDRNELIDKKNKQVLGTLSLNRNNDIQEQAFKNKDFSKLLNCLPSTIEYYVEFNNMSLILKDEKSQVLIRESIFKYVENKIMTEYKLKELSDAREEIKTIKEEIKLSEKEVIDFFEKYTTTKDKVDNLNEQVKSLRMTRDDLERTIGNIEKKFNEEQGKIKLLESFGLITNSYKTTSNENPDTIPIHHFMIDDEIAYYLLVSYIHAYILKRNLYYSRETILDFLALVRTHDFIILAGKSGVGKTSLVKEFARAVNGNCTIIPVKPNWMSKEDLLGYYNPIQREYISTEFLDVLIEAEHNPNKPYFICLDEMNLARVEYYFADFLSKMEERGNNAVLIELYPVHLYPNIKKIMEQLQDKKPSDITVDNIKDFEGVISLIKEHYQIEKHEEKDVKELYELFLNIIPKVPPKISIGHNVHFFGTANIDDTTNYFSPKVLDRVQVLKFNNDKLFRSQQEIRNTLENYKNTPYEDSEVRAIFQDLSKSVDISEKQDQILGIRQKYEYVESNIDSKLAEINQNFLINLKIDFGYRLLMQANHYFKQWNELLIDTSEYKRSEWNTSDYEPSYAIYEERLAYTISGFLIHKIFPRIIITDERILANLINLSAYLQENELIYLGVREELQKIITYCQEHDFHGTYWSV